MFELLACSNYLEFYLLMCVLPMLMKQQIKVVKFASGCWHKSKHIIGKSWQSCCFSQYLRRSTTKSKWPVRPAISDQPVHPPSLLSLHYSHEENLVLSFLLSTLRRLSDCTDAQADLSNCWEQLFCWFCHAAALFVLELLPCLLVCVVFIH